METLTYEPLNGLEMVIFRLHIRYTKTKKSKSVAKDHIKTLYRPDKDHIEIIVNQSIMFNFAADKFPVCEFLTSALCRLTAAD